MKYELTPDECSEMARDYMSGASLNQLTYWWFAEGNPRGAVGAVKRHLRAAGVRLRSTEFEKKIGYVGNMTFINSISFSLGEIERMLVMRDRRRKMQLWSLCDGV